MKMSNVKSTCIRLEFMLGGDMKSRLLNENVSKFFFYQMCHAIEYIHGQKVTHRDLKPGNTSLSSFDDNALVKIADFGVS